MNKFEFSALFCDERVRIVQANIHLSHHMSNALSFITNSNNKAYIYV
jgi:hypothetical protein